ncbi:fluoride efflux transporter CrcB [Herbiconiux sp. KACC 21604]|uniref:fluoride efflux transporter CrcB n=1 Tax=unclassified Herbiconiux TaxID=2618217 RepID=UPI001491DB5F|nr:fluoride efflux transporter CrcB [Herbiconiux sp. SALV-R1]QJU56193.1 fluoride efflux transporter CrcB [Herbiconiux sp. SALV-R1]WPO88758.1 fluoride efflux transporter CrcB [Herbiconiux sp. KACC 21604]
MTPLLMLALSAAGGLGAVVRFVLDGVIKRVVPSSFPVGVMVINVSGSFLLGLLTGLVLAGTVSHEWLLVLGTGFLGGYTTFSTASFETIRLLQTRRYTAALANGLGMLLLAVTLAYLGLYVGTLTH